jgi:hypothetical protein
MIKQTLRLAIVLCGISLAGCQMDTTADDLPPPRLSAPVMAYPAPPVQPRVAVAPRPLPQPQQASAVMPRAEMFPTRGVPTGWIPPVPAAHWNWIIIHHSDSAFGSAAIIDQWHKARGFDELGYHFVIGNGTNSGDGQIEVGPRWTKQKWGAHDNALDNRYNKEGIGICLVGDFNVTHPTAAQQKSLLKLVVYLMKTYNVPADRVLGHGETKGTECPGKFLNVASVRSQAAQMVAAGDVFPSESVLAIDLDLPKQ